MMIRYALALALLSAPASALAQAAPEEGPVMVEIVASGKVTVPAQRFRFSVKLTAKGEDQDAAGAALAANRAKLVQALAALNVRESEALDGAPNSIMSLFAGIAGRSKPSFSMDSLDDNDGEKQQATATETVMFDAPNRSALASAQRPVEANGGAIEENVVALLDDYVGPTRRAKADAIAKARAEAAAYAQTLGLRRATIAKVSERQDVVAGSLNFISQLIGMFAPKTDTTSDNVSIQTNLTIEFRLSR